MAISPVSANSAAGDGTSFSMPAHQVGHLLVRFDYRDGSIATPTLASGWTNWPGTPTGTGNTQSARLSYKWALSDSETAGAAANATGVAIMVYDGCGAPGAVAWDTGASNTITYPALTRSITDGTSWGGRFAGHRTATNLTANAPSTVPNTARTGVATECRGLDSNGPLGSDPTSGTQSVNQNSGWEAVTFELTAAGAAFDTLVDDFNMGSVPDPGVWTVTNNGGTTTTLASGRVEHTAPSAGNNTNMQSAELFSLIGTSVFFQVFDLPHTSPSGYIGVIGSSTVVAWIPVSATEMRPQLAATPVGSARTHTPGDWYRVREAAGTVYWDFSSDGVNWTNAHAASLSVGQMGTLRRARALGVVGNISVGTLSWDNLNIVPATGLPVKVYLGGNWVTKPAKRWNGSAWVEFNPKIWDGSQWT